MKSIQFLDNFKDRVFVKKKPSLGDYALMTGAALGGLHLMNAANRTEAPVAVLTDQTAQKYGEAVPVANSDIILSDEVGGVSLPLNVKSLDEEGLRRQSSYLERKIATDLITLRQLEAMQQQIEQGIAV